jgi:hypothetical protein
LAIYRFHRSWAQQRQIYRDILSGSSDDALVAAYSLSEIEISECRSLAHRFLDRFIVKHSIFKHFYTPRIRRPFAPVLITALVIVILCAFTDSEIFLKIGFSNPNPNEYPLFTAAVGLIAVAVAAVGWAFAAWVAHRNSRLQHTINIVFTRFAQAPFADNLKRFHKTFGFDPLPRVTRADIEHAERPEASDEERDAAQAVKFILNYFEFISMGVLKGDLDIEVIRRTLRGNMLYYFDKTAPLIVEARKSNPKSMEHYAELILHLREP